MSGFCMLAGTLASDLPQQDLLLLLQRNGISASTRGDEILIAGDIQLALRTGFEHEYILVGHSRDEAVLVQACTQVSARFTALKLEHEIEVYDVGNALIATLGFQADLPSQ